MGIRSVGGRGLRRADGAYFVLTSEKQPYCRKYFLASRCFPHILGVGIGNLVLSFKTLCIDGGT